MRGASVLTLENGTDRHWIEEVVLQPRTHLLALSSGRDLVRQCRGRCRGRPVASTLVNVIGLHDEPESLLRSMPEMTAQQLPHGPGWADQGT